MKEIITALLTDEKKRKDSLPELLKEVDVFTPWAQ